MPPKNPYPWPFFVAMAANLLLFFGVQALFPTLPLYIVAIGGSSADNGLASWAFALAALLVRSPAGFLSDHWGRKPVLVLGAILLGGGPLLYALAPNVPLLLGARVIHGVGMALFGTAYQAFIADLLTPGRYGEGLGLAGISSTVMMAIAPVAGEWVAREFGFDLLFLTIGAVGGLGMLATLVLPGRERSERARAGGVREVLRQPQVRAGSLAMAVLGVSFGAFITFLPLLANARRLGETGLVFTAYALASALMQPLAGRAADRWGSGRVILTALALITLTSSGLSVVSGKLALMMLAAFFGVGLGAARVGVDACVQESIGASLRGSAAAVQYTAFDLLIGFGSLGLGLLADATDYGVMYGVVSGITLAGLAVGALMVKGQKRASG
ncbi:MAG: hypothetical protein DRJ03_20320 [Chloroflexi bacterium]|nr:MAG: hypothetical protein DRJ03_20320 [Chloroflexota bacterium]